MIDLRIHPEGIVLPVRASPGARQDAVRGVHNGALKVSVTQAPEKGKANKAIRQVLAEALGLKRSQIQLLSGATSGKKEFLIRDLTVEELRRRIESSVEDL